MTVVLVILIAFIIFCIVMAIRSSANTPDNYITRLENEKKQLNDILNNNKSFNPTKVVTNEDYELFTYYVGADDINGRIFCFSGSSGVFFNYTDIVTAEIVIDGKVTETKKSPSIGGTIVGGVVAGGIGAVIGGTNMATETTAEHVSTIKVHILLRNSSINNFDVVCYDGVGPIKTTNEFYKKIYRNAQDVFDILRLAMDKSLKETVVESSKETSSIEELKALADLKKQGLITEEEFATMKAKIINK